MGVTSSVQIGQPHLMSTTVGTRSHATPNVHGVSSIGTSTHISPSFIQPNDTGKMVKPSKADVIAFGGIKENLEARIRSRRLCAQPNADATQMERAQKISQRRDEMSSSGYSTCCALDTAMVSLAPGGSAGAYGYWMQPAVVGCSGLLFPGYWMAAY